MGRQASAAVKHRWSVFLYVPNVVGYLRIILSIAAFTRWRSPRVFFTLYLLGFILDAADGLAARILQQSTEFGAQLDMVTDRVATGALLCVLASLYPNAAPVCVALAFLDGYSHWMQMVAGVVAGAESHKTATTGRMLSWYYSRPVLTVVCSLNEMCFLMLYIKAFDSGPWAWKGVRAFDIILAVSAPVCVLKQVISVAQLFSAHNTIAGAIGKQRRVVDLQ